MICLNEMKYFSCEENDTRYVKDFFFSHIYIYIYIYIYFLFAPLMMQVAKKMQFIYISLKVLFSLYLKKKSMGLENLLIAYSIFFYGKRNSEIDLIAWMFHELLSISSIICEVRQKWTVQTHSFCALSIYYSITLFFKEKFVQRGFD